MSLLFTYLTMNRYINKNTSFIIMFRTLRNILVIKLLFRRQDLFKY